MQELAPILLFVFNRPWHTQKTIEALVKNDLAEQSYLYVFSDGARNDSDLEKINEIRNFLKTIDGFKKVEVICRKKNLGLSQSITTGISEIFHSFDRVIVLEDDLITAPNFLKFMNESLAKYKNNPKVFSISGYSHSNEIRISESTYFLSLTSSWGWSTWADKWDYFKKDDSVLESILADTQHSYEFNFDNSFDYFGLLKKQLSGKADSWAIYWYTSVYLEKGLTLYPAKSLVSNIGFDGSGRHCGHSKQDKIVDAFDYELTDEIYEKKDIRKIIGRELFRKRTSLWQKLKDRFESHLKSLTSFFNR